jgi:hypothetical protein
MLCPECEKRRIAEGHNTCYPCHIQGVGFTFRGGGFQAGRRNFSARTNAEFVAEHVGDVKGNPNIEPLR